MACVHVGRPMFWGKQGQHGDLFMDSRLGLTPNTEERQTQASHLFDARLVG